jgi:hypothetical protein|tara:strand:+ start:340 stop:879 length:540 start_codon:yes stop_codon:yes gene_type:complete
MVFQDLSGYGNDISMTEGEDIMFSADNVLLTNQRVIVAEYRNRRQSGNKTSWIDGPIAESMPPVLKNGGKTGRKDLGFKLTLFGGILISLNLVPFTLFGTNIFQAMGDIIESIYFLVSMLSLTVGIYFTLGSYVNPKPHTTALFTFPGGGRDLVAVFPGWDNSDAEEMGKVFRRIRRTV